MVARLLVAGLASSLVAAILAIAGSHYAMYGWFAVATAILAIGGLGALTAGIFGVIFGGRHKKGQRRVSSNWKTPG